MDLGKYAQVVLWSYAGAIALILALIALSLWQAAKTRHALRAVETRAPRAVEASTPRAVEAGTPRAGVDPQGKPNDQQGKPNG